jgi:predicted transcriptional regulator
VKRLGELERAVMDVLWGADGPLGGRDVLAALSERGPAYTTVLTVLDRLIQKGVVRRERDGRLWQYEAVASRDSYIAMLMLEALDLTGDRDAALVRFVSAIGTPDADTLRDALERSAGEPKT